MIPDQRRDFIYRYVHEKNVASFNELAELMNVSHMTVRRDIQLLEEEGKVVAINGGVKLNNLLKIELPWREKALLHHEVKRNMGALAAMLIEPGQTLYLDAGTSLFEVAKAVAASNCFNLTVVTNDFSISHYLMDMPHITLYHTGGLVDQRNRSCLGKSAASFPRTINIDVAFLSSSSWDLERGMSTPSEGKASVKEAVLNVSRRRVLVSDSSKFGKYGMFHICALDRLTDIICDQQLPFNVQQEITLLAIKLHLVAAGKEVIQSKTGR
ncbi:DeoR/GlpR family DNA-binding transcription regulator [Erwiniaceae bacterium BAC15a-03b]|uniref:DeoR/GlpR family DNA-binding transcription regulator n=1 Tax=Winslowiella arboricola TaxID=2978220 RepID=A0A9J6PU80_9GAMM|nr:DeoR/GlpR family DNA-binding transcription regulator [Winslowiella arboricola]MCU5774821.1 DeoR/GlpR family DNA-binding transcription regulator [Winslowiella arboricola]MCU5780027.1 DeoR/GlpR family DNA-binding transcription regulator [Winslowiella arboricola]